jgi:uncharacterized membrane protein YhiD involved in acid resistance
MASVVAGGNFLGAGILVRLEADLVVFLRRLIVVVDGLTFAAAMRISIGEARVLPPPLPVKEVS